MARCWCSLDLPCTAVFDDLVLLCLLRRTILTRRARPCCRGDSARGRLERSSRRAFVTSLAPGASPPLGSWRRRNSAVDAAARGQWWRGRRGRAVPPVVRLLRPQPLTTHGDRRRRGRRVSLVLRVSTYYYQHPPTIHGVAVKRKNKMGDGRRDPKGHQANSAR